MADPNRAIPPESYALVRDRNGGRCIRCGGNGNQWHHRRSRRVRAGHRHCACNGAWLCGSDHRMVHAEPEQARREGLVISQWVDEPFGVPFRDSMGWWWRLTCAGGYEPLTEDDLVTDGMGGYLIA